MILSNFLPAVHPPPACPAPSFSAFSRPHLDRHMLRAPESNHHTAAELPGHELRILRRLRWLLRIPYGSSNPYHGQPIVPIPLKRDSHWMCEWSVQSAGIFRSRRFTMPVIEGAAARVLRVYSRLHWRRWPCSERLVLSCFTLHELLDKVQLRLAPDAATNNI